MLAPSHTANELRETEIRDRAYALWDHMKGEKPGVFGSDLWVAKLLDWSMQRPELKVDLFRLVDVLPALEKPSQIQDHVEEYLGGSHQDMPKALRAIFKVAASGMPAIVTAKVVQKSVREMASRFIVAEDLKHALPHLRGMYRDGIAATLDLLGEVTYSRREAEVYRERYLELITTLPRAMAAWPDIPVLEHNHLGPIPRANVSIKLSALEPHLDPVDMNGSVNRLLNAVTPLLIEARERGVFINVDMEHWALHEITLAFFERALELPELRAWPHIGIAIQAYATSAAADLQRLLGLAQRRGAPITVRLVKGAYWDYEVVHARQHGFECPVFQNKAATDANFETLSRFLLENVNDLAPAFGSHNLRSVAHALAYADELGVPPNAYEFQTLFGMAEPLRAALRENGHRVRVYAPIGPLLPGMAYLVRRLLENTSNEGFLRLSYHDAVDLDTMLAPPPPRQQEQTPKWPPPPNLDAEFQNTPHCDFTRAAEREAIASAAARMSETFPIHVPIVISGEVRDGDEIHHRLSPNDGRTIIAEVRMATTHDVDDAVEAAAIAWPAWRDRPVRDRAERLEALAARLTGDRDRLAALQVHETAKPWADADGDVTEAIDFCRYYARRALEELSPRELNLVPGERNTLIHEGRGPVAVIAPWNFPLAILCGMTTAALVSGNTVIMKPAEQSSAVAYALYRHMIDAGFPPEAVQFVPGCGEEIGPHLVAHPRIAHVAFTGSKAVGLSILESIGAHRPGQTHVKSAICEMGGKNAIIIDSDADLDEAVAGVLHSAFGYAGQKCSAGSRVLVLDDVYDIFERRLVDATRSLHIAPATDPACQIPPVIDTEARYRLLNEIDRAEHEGLVVFRGGLPSEGNFVPPVILRIKDTTHRLMQEELFGPLLGITRVSTFTDAIDIANASEYALTGAVYSRTPSHLDLARARFRVGNLYLNRPSTGSMVGRQPFGGFKLSGTDAKAGGPGYLPHFTDARCITENTIRRGFTPEIML